MAQLAQSSSNIGCFLTRRVNSSDQLPKTKKGRLA
jgi:hypothetical protein